MTAGWVGAAVRQAWPYALISGATVLTAFLRLPPLSLPHKYAAGDDDLLLPYTICSVLVAGFGVSVVLRCRPERDGRRPPWRHLAVPPALGVLLPAILINCGGARSRWETGLLCAAAAAGTHLAVTMPRRLVRALLCGLLAAATATIAGACQTRWRAEDFRATGQPFVVAEVPGYRLTGTYADDGAIFLAYRDVAGQAMIVDATIGATCSVYFAAGTQLRCVDLPGGHALAVALPHRSGSDVRVPLPAGIVVRPVTATYLASFPVSHTSRAD